MSEKPTPSTDESFQMAEKYQVPELDNVLFLLSPPQKYAASFSETQLKEPAEEIVSLLRRPVEMSKRTLEGLDSGNFDVHQSVREGFEREFRGGAEALRFLDSFCRNFKGEDGCDEVIISAKTPKEAEGIIFRISPYNDTEGIGLGTIEDEPIFAAELVIKTSAIDTSEAYTPMQINFRFLGRRDEEIRSLRVDIHTERDNTVQVDAELGKYDFKERRFKRTPDTHMPVKSLSGKDYEEKFRKQQAMLVINVNNLLRGKNVDKSSVPIIKDQVGKAWETLVPKKVREETKH